MKHFFLYALVTCACGPAVCQIESSKAAISAALIQHKAGQTTQAIQSLENYLKTASSVEAPEPMLRLAYLYTAAKRKNEAREKFLRLANLPTGLDDAVKGEAALRMAYLTNGKERGIWAERIVAGQFQVDEASLVKAYRLAAGAAHQRGDLRRAIELYQWTPEIELGGANKSYLFKELAGLYFELAKGEGDAPVAEKIRPDMFVQARQLCTELTEMNGAPDVDRMVGDLMYAETWLFEGEFQKCYDSVTLFFSKWGKDPSIYNNQNMRKYVNTAKTLQTQICYFLAKNSEAEAIALELVNNRPKKGDEFKNSDSLLIGLLILKACANDRGDQETVAIYGSRAWQHRSDYLGTEWNLQRRRTAWLERTAK